MASARRSIDWDQVWFPGPKRPFTADEMARAGADAPSPTLVAAVLVNFAALALLVLLLAPASKTAPMTAAFAALGVTAAGFARWLWWRPWRTPLLKASLATGGVLGLSGLVVKRGLDPGQADLLMLSLLIGGALVAMLFWFLVVWRARQIEDRLRAQAEREKAIEMARRLAAAQLEPHFLFNTLSSLQHWVQTGDPRAAPLMEALTCYLRATLPLFDRPSLAAADEIKVIQSYLQIMQARLGEARLRWQIDVQADALRARIAPGLLLTLVENAVEHGVEPLLAGGMIELRGARQGDAVIFEVDDNGPGPAADCADGVGLANARERLALTAGSGASLTLGVRADGGCRAQVRLAFVAEEPAP